MLTTAIRENREVCFKYRKPGQAQARWRRVQPYHLACIENHWFLFTFDVDRRALRTFVLGRLSKPELTDARFMPVKFDLNEHLLGSIGVFKGS